MNRSDLIQQRLAALHDAMKRHKLDIYFVPTADPHNSEYIAEHWKTREWFSGFRGSAGTLVVFSGQSGALDRLTLLSASSRRTFGHRHRIDERRLGRNARHCRVDKHALLHFERKLHGRLGLRHLRHWTVLRRFFKLRDERCGSRRRNLERPPGAAETPHCSPSFRVDK